MLKSVRVQTSVMSVEYWGLGSGVACRWVWGLELELG